MVVPSKVEMKHKNSKSQVPYNKINNDLQIKKGYSHLTGKSRISAAFDKVFQKMDAKKMKENATQDREA